MQCPFYEEFSQDPTPKSFPDKFCHMSGERKDADWCKGNMVNCPLTKEGRFKLMEGVRK